MAIDLAHTLSYSYHQAQEPLGGVLIALSQMASSSISASSTLFKDTS